MAKITISNVQPAEELGSAELTEEEQTKVTGGAAAGYLTGGTGFAPLFYGGYTLGTLGGVYAGGALSDALGYSAGSIPQSLLTIGGGGLGGVLGGLGGAALPK